MEPVSSRFPDSAEEQTALPANFSQLVRDALRHLHDPVYLQTHPLTRLLAVQTDSSLARDKRLHQALLDGITALNLGPHTSDIRVSRRFDLLRLRYVEALEIDAVCERLAISRREYTRVHRQALDAVAALLQDGAAFPLSPAPILRTSSAPRSIPRPLTSFIGREQVVQDVFHLLRSARLVTLSGPPGTGKTRLALEVAEALTASSAPGDLTFHDGITFVPLASVLDPRLVVATIAKSMSVREAPDRSLIESLEDHLSHHYTLLILDNFEHLLESAPVVSRLLTYCPNLTVLVTSRASLRLSGEHELVVPPLGLPEQGEPLPLEDIVRSEAVHLYVDRARAAHSSFRLTEQNASAVLEICRWLDGLPLAIELAAARARLFPTQALLGRLSHPLQFLINGPRDLPGRQQTLRNAIDWSYQLLTGNEQQLFAQLSVFAGGWTLESAEAVCASRPEFDTLEGVASLVDKNLVRQEEMAGGEPRFAMLRTIREYAQEQLEAMGEEARTVRRRHAAYYLAYARAADATIVGREWASSLRRLEHELDNLRTVLAWLRDTGEIETALGLAGTLDWFWVEGGHWTEARTWLESLLATNAASDRTEGRAAALAALGRCNRCMGDFAAGRGHLEESLAIWRELGDSRGIGRACIELALVMAAQGNQVKGRRLTEEGLLQAEVAGDRAYVGLALAALGTQTNDEAEGRARFEQSRHVWQEIGSIWGLSLVSKGLGDLARSRGRYAEAAAHYRESVELIDQTEPRMMRAVYLHNLGHVTHRLGDEQRARELFEEALLQFREMGDRRGVAECVAGLAGLAAETEPRQTARLFGAAMAAAEQLGSQLNPSNQPDYDHNLSIARCRLGDEQFDIALRQGRLLTLEQAVYAALQNPTMAPDTFRR